MRFLIQVFTQYGYMDLGTGYNWQTGQDTLIKGGQRKQVEPRSLHANLVSPVTQREPLIAPNMTDPMLLPAEYLSQLCECHHVHESHMFGRSWRRAWWAVFSTAINRVSNLLCFVLFGLWRPANGLPLHPVSKQTNKQKKRLKLSREPSEAQIPPRTTMEMFIWTVYMIYLYSSCQTNKNSG